MKVQQYIQYLKEWSGKETCTIIYSNENEELSARIVNSKIQGKKNLYFIIEDCQGNIFGSYHSFIPTEYEKKVHQQEDHHHFIFTLKNPYNILPTKYLPTEHNDHILSLYQNYDINNVMNVQYCYGISTQRGVFLYENIINYYQNIPSQGCCFLTGTANTFLDITHFLIVQTH